MSRVNALSILQDATTKAKLNEIQAGVVENLQKNGNSFRFKAKASSLDTLAGSYEFKRYANAVSKDYGTARTAGKGDQIVAPPVTVKVDQNKEIIEELSKFDAERFGVEAGLLNIAERRNANHRAVMGADIERAFWKEAVIGAVAPQNGVVGSVTGFDGSEDIEDVLEGVFNTIEETQNKFVTGIERTLMGGVLRPSLYGKLKNKLNKLTNTGFLVRDEELFGLNGVALFSEIFLPKKVLGVVQVLETVAQPANVNEYDAERIPLSNDYALSLFYDYGTKTLAPDLTAVIIETDATHDKVETVATLPVFADVKEDTIYFTNANSVGYDSSQPITDLNYPAGTMFTAVKGTSPTINWTQYNA